MENEETTDELEVEQEDESVEEEAGSETQETQATNTLTIEERLAKAEASAAKFQRLFEKAKRGKGTETTVTTQTNQAAPSPVNVEEVVLKAQGMDDELLTQLKDVAALRKVSLLDAQKDPLFVAAKNQYEKDVTTRRASAGASRGSGAAKVTKSLSTAGLSREEHMKLVRG